jgi:MFS family permease
LTRNRDFNVFWAGQTLSGLGDTFAIIALPLLVLAATGSLIQMGLVTGTFGAASLVAGIVSGPIVDRVDRRRLMIACDVIRAVAYSVIPLTWWLVGPRVAVIYVVTAIGAFFGNAFQVAAITAVANLVDRDDLTEANGRLQGSYALMFLIGPLIAGTLCQRFGAHVAIGLDALSFAVSAVSLQFMRLRRASAERKQEEGWFPNLIAGVRFLWNEPSLRWITILLGGFSFVASAFLDLFIFHLKRDLHQNDAAVGMVFGVAALGSIFGALLASPMRRRFGFGATWLFAGFIQGAAVLLMGRAGTVFGIALFASVFSFAMLVRNVSSISMRQEITPDHLLGRVTAAFWTLITAPAPLGAMIATAIAERVGVGRVFVGMGAFTIVLATIGVFSPLRRR